MRKVDGTGETGLPGIENLIVKRLDGELAERDQLTLDRELIRDPAARDMLESYERIDQLAADALQHAIGAGETRIDAQTMPQRAVANRATSRRWMWQLATGAIAAALLAVFVARLAPGVSPIDTTIAGIKTPIPVQQIGTPPPMHPEQNGLMRNVGNARPKIWRDTGRGMFGVVGDDGNIYWIGIDRTRTAKINRSERM